MPKRKHSIEAIAIDFVRELPESEAFYAIPVVTDWFTTVEHYMLAKTTWTAEDVANSYINDVWTLYGLAKHIALDYSAQFHSKFLK